MSLPTQIDHERAKTATMAVEKTQGFAPERFKKFRSVVLSAGVSVRQLGLLQFVVFGIGKGGEYLDVLSALFNWLDRSKTTKHIVKGMDFSGDKIKFMNKLLKRNATDIAALEAESQHFLLWLKRLTEGLEKQRRREEESGDGAENEDGGP